MESEKKSSRPSTVRFAQNYKDEESGMMARETSGLSVDGDSFEVPPSIAPSTRSAPTTVVSKDLIRRRTAYDMKALTLSDMKAVVRRSHTFSEVTMEQIERVRNVHKKLSKGAEHNFNYNTLLLVASILAGLGLASNSSTTIIASMLVSPIMGPVVGIAYGATIWDWKLVMHSIKTECLSLLVCVLVGVMIGACIGPTSLGATWPTEEMVNRSTWQNFLVAIPIAFFSGLGVAVGVLDDQTSSLVGVAISASLLPPAVSCGMMWVAYGLVPTSEYTHQDFFVGGMVSLLLTLVNIILVAAASMFMFRLKERLPIEKNIFWDDMQKFGGDASVRG